MTHKLKIYESYANAIVDGRKKFEVRLNDRGYNAGDMVKFKVIDENYKGSCLEAISHPLHHMLFRITYVHSGLGLKENYVVFGIEQCEEGE